MLKNQEYPSKINRFDKIHLIFVIHYGWGDGSAFKTHDDGSQASGTPVPGSDASDYRRQARAWCKNTQAN